MSKGNLFETWKSYSAGEIINRMRGRGANVLALFLLFLLWNAPVSSSDREFGLSKGKAGLIKAGMTIDELYANVGRNNTRLVDQHSEGSFSPAIEIYLKGTEGKGRSE